MGGTIEIVEPPQPTSPDQPIGDWVVTNHFGAGERSIGPVSSASECIAKVRSDCPEFDLANMAVNEAGSNLGCWCQKSKGHTLESRADNSSNYKTVRVRPLPDPAMNLDDGCMSEWVQTQWFNQFGGRNIGPVQSVQECIEKVKQECPGYDLVNVGRDTDDVCYCHNSSGLEFNSSYLQTCSSLRTCRILPYEPYNASAVIEEVE